MHQCLCDDVFLIAEVWPNKLHNAFIFCLHPLDVFDTNRDEFGFFGYAVCLVKTPITSILKDILYESTLNSEVQASIQVHLAASFFILFF